MRSLPPPRFLAVVFGTLAVLIWLASFAQAASIKVCFKDVATDVTEVKAFAGTSDVGQLLPGQSQVDGSICAAISPIPAAVTPGTTKTWTLKAFNALGQESAPSNALTFRLPSVPTPPTLLSVGATAP